MTTLAILLLLLLPFAAMMFTAESVVAPRPGPADLLAPAPRAEPRVVVQHLATRACIRGEMDDAQEAASGTTLSVGSMLSCVADATLHPFVCSAFADVALLPGPGAPLRCAVQVGGLNQGLGAPPFPAQWRTSQVDLELRLLLPNEPGMTWRIDACAVLLSTQGLGNGSSRVLIGIDDDDADTDEVDWSCLASKQAKTLRVSSQRDVVPIWIRVVGQVESWDATGPEHFLTQVTLDFAACSDAPQPGGPAARIR